MKNYQIRPVSAEELPVIINDDTLDELATLVEAGEIEVNQLSDDLINEVINYQLL